MDKFNLEKDIEVCCITATSFPEGVMDAHEKAHSLFPVSNQRRYFGISSPNPRGIIIYKAAVEKLENDQKEKTDYESFVIKKGDYISVVIKDYMKDIQKVETTFQKLISRDDIDPNGYCLEWYLNDNDMRCMVRLK
ncbi:hypothetical protein [Leptospira sp. 'Mane']|uniref:hypothetical protein n=1 Tax=Leptospira sp. 'Mane' TaxID=3387407 RepID=UPI00398B63D7